MESIRIDIDKPTITFAMAGVDLTTFDFYEYSGVVDDAYKAMDADPSFDVANAVRNWMLTNGLPSTVSALAVADWMVAVDKHIGEMSKKATG